jgi:hypothetical protein
VCSLGWALLHWVPQTEKHFQLNNEKESKKGRKEERRKEKKKERITRE